MQTFLIGEAAKATGLTPHTIRFYESRGLLPRARRSMTGYRRYDEVDLRRLRLVHNARTLGIPLDEIRVLLEDVHSASCSSFAEKVHAMVQRQRSEIDARIAELERIRESLANLAIDAEAASRSSQKVSDCTCCLLIDEAAPGETAFCAPAPRPAALRFSGQLLDVLQCNIDSRPDAPTPEEIVVFLLGSEIRDGTLTLRFDANGEDAVRQFAAAECVCCSSMGWEVNEAAGSIQLTISGSREQLEIVASAWPIVGEVS